jgi:hypothetical protein
MAIELLWVRMIVYRRRALAGRRGSEVLALRNLGLRQNELTLPGMYSASVRAGPRQPYAPGRLLWNKSGNWPLGPTKRRRPQGKDR